MYVTKKNKKKTEKSYSRALIYTNEIKRTLKQYEILQNDDVDLSW